jgi:Ca2+/Na+ antiporter
MLNYVLNLMDAEIGNKQSNMIKGIFLLLLAVSGNFIAETLGCKTQKLLSENMYAKQLVTFIIIYFSLGVTDSSNTSPTDNIIFSVQIWIFFLMFTKMNVKFTISAFMLLGVLLILKNYVDYYKTHNDKNKNKDKIKYLQRVSTIVMTILITITIIGFLKYLTRQKAEHKDNFSYTKFFIGTTTCDHNTK